MDVDAITRERAEEFTRFTRDQGTAASQRLSTWVILANGAGMALTINAVLSGALPQDYPFKIAYGLFLVGTGSAYFAQLQATRYIAKYMIRLYEMNTRMVNSQHRGFLSAQLAAENVPPPPDWAKLDEEDEGLFEKAKTWPLEGHRALRPARWLSTISVVCLIAALSLPLFFPIERSGPPAIERPILPPNTPS